MSAKKWIILLLLLAVAGLGAWSYTAARSATARLDGETRKSFKLLAEIRDTNDLPRVVGTLGAWFTYSTNEWLAIRYRDGSRPDWSVAVARDSEGNWFQTDRRFGGALASYHLKRVRHAKLLTERLTDSYASYDDANKAVVDKAIAGADPAAVPAMAPYHALALATNLAAARPALIALGFKPVER